MKKWQKKILFILLSGMFNHSLSNVLEEVAQQFLKSTIGFTAISFFLELPLANKFSATNKILLDKEFFLMNDIYRIFAINLEIYPPLLSGLLVSQKFFYLFLNQEEVYKRYCSPNLQYKIRSIITNHPGYEIADFFNFNYQVDKVPNIFRSRYDLIGEPAHFISTDRQTAFFNFMSFLFFSSLSVFLPLPRNNYTLIKNQNQNIKEEKARKIQLEFQPFSMEGRILAEERVKVFSSEMRSLHQTTQLVQYSNMEIQNFIRDEVSKTLLSSEKVNGSYATHIKMQDYKKHISYPRIIDSITLDRSQEKKIQKLLFSLKDTAQQIHNGNRKKLSISKYPSLVITGRGYDKDYILQNILHKMYRYFEKINILPIGLDSFLSVLGDNKDNKSSAFQLELLAKSKRGFSIYDCLSGLIKNIFSIKSSVIDVFVIKLEEISAHARGSDSDIMAWVTNNILADYCSNGKKFMIIYTAADLRKIDPALIRRMNIVIDTDSDFAEKNTRIIHMMLARNYELLDLNYSFKEYREAMGDSNIEFLKASGDRLFFDLSRLLFESRSKINPQILSEYIRLNLG